ncbi:amidohydrolase [Limnohabitans sp. 2KL-1]|uniref:amidohydrolase family protein n=1 Tax=Limnohabitans sp. 2KL-1 TaxID=1100699 RepID=UPI000D38B1CD|nr:amidohydrolase family protein [Limnohabitans sp. 2KL-1]PUE49332.1 amidohydrolase [Limnohabitans sp. 2KL-1]
MTAVSWVVPPGACDCHMHAYDEAYPLASTATFKPPHAPMADYAQVQAALRLTRVVVVQPTGYGFDNRCTLAAVASMPGRARAVAMVPVQVSDTQLQAMHAAGVRGVRMMMFPGGLLGWDALAPMAVKVQPLGWHLNVQFNGCEFVQRLPLLQSLDVPLVIDHNGKFLEPPSGTDDPAFQALCRLLDTGRVWVKLSAPYETSRHGAPYYDDVGLLARYLATHYPERCLWASNWPHPNQDPVPSNAALLNLLPAWVACDADLQRILVDNPAQLYGFDA